MAKSEVKSGHADCQHTYTRQDKKTFQILTRVCTRCGQEELISDEPLLDELTMRKLVKR